MTPPTHVGLPEALERAAAALRGDADDIRPANGDPIQLRRLLGDEGAVRVLRWLLENEPAAGGELVDAWAEDPDLDAAPILAVSEEGLPKLAKKALRRALHRLRSRGVAVAEPVREPVVAKIASVEDQIEAGVVAPIDSRGTRVVYLVEGNPSGGARIFEAVLDEQRGVVAFDVYSASRGKVRRFLREITSMSGRAAVPAPPDALRALVARVAGYQPSNRPPPRAYSEWRSRVAAAPEGTATPGEMAAEALGPAEPDRLERALELVQQHELGPWPPDDPALQAAAEKISEMGESALVVSASARREQADGIIDESVDELYGAPFADRCAERCEEMAYVYWKWEREDDARACLAAAEAFRGEAPDRRPIARAMLEVLLEPVLNKLNDEGAAEESPAMAPG